MQSFRLLVCVVLAALALSGMAATMRVLATGDMGGYLKGKLMDGYRIGSPAAMLGAWKAREGYAPGNCLVLSCGDVMGGQPISTLLEGEPDIEVMNAMGFQASAVGVHEFDFGRGQFLRLQGQAKFPFLAANLTYQDGTPADIGQPYALIDVQGVKVGVIGLIPQTVLAQGRLPALKAGYYTDALRKYVPEMRVKGAQVVIVIAQISATELAALARAVPELRIPLMLGGFSHRLEQAYVDESDTWVMTNGEEWAGYGRIDLEIDEKDGAVQVTQIRQVRLQQRAPAPDPAVQTILDRWQARLGPDYTKAVGYSSGELLRSYGGGAFVLQCWLAADQAADFAINNYGGVRQDLPAGPFTRGDIINMLPFDDKLFRIKMTGKQLMAFRAPRGEPLAMGGLRLADGQLVWARGGQPIDEKTVYKVLVTDYLYAKSGDLKAADPAPVVVLPDWRIPLYRWVAEHATSEKRPVEKEMALLKPLRVTENGIMEE